MTPKHKRYLNTRDINYMVPKRKRCLNTRVINPMVYILPNVKKAIPYTTIGKTIWKIFQWRQQVYPRNLFICIYCNCYKKKYSTYARMSYKGLKDFESIYSALIYIDLTTGGMTSVRAPRFTRIYNIYKINESI